MAEAGLTINVWNHDGVAFLDLVGSLTSLEAPLLLDAVDAAIGRSATNLQLGLRQVTFIDSSGLQALVRTRDRANAAGVPLQLLTPSVRVRRVLEATGLKRAFDLVE